MKILITGMTALQCGLKTPLKFHGIGAMYADALRIAGHEVTQDELELHDDFSQFDVVLFGISALGSISARRCFIILDAIMRARSLGVRMAFFVDDWRLGEIGTSIKTIIKNPYHLYGGGLKRPSSRKHPEWARDNLDWLMACVNALNDNPWPPTLVPVHGFAANTDLKDGPLRTMLPARRLAAVDITPMAHTYEELSKRVPAERERVWMNAALSNDETWMKTLNFTWPIHTTAKLQTKITERITTELIDRVPEPVIVQRYGEVWGVLSRPYKQHIGTGYWRYRFVQAARMGNVMVCDPREINSLEPYCYQPAQLEDFTTDQLAWVADAQREAFFAQSWSREQLVTAVHDLAMEAV